MKTILAVVACSLLVGCSALSESLSSQSKAEEKELLPSTRPAPAAAAAPAPAAVVVNPPVVSVVPPMLPATQPLRDLSKPPYTPADCPAWAKETLPDWLKPYMGKNGLPEPYHSQRGALSDPDVIGLDRYQANNFIVYRAETASYIYNDYTPLKVDYKPGTLPTYEKVSAKYTAGCTTDTEKAVALLTKALVDVFRHTGMPPVFGKPVKPDRGLEDEPLLISAGGWCSEQARVFIRLCEVNGIPARMIHLFGQSHTIAEFYADGRWALADASFFFVVPGKDGKLLSAADCHDQAEGQRYYALAKQKRIMELIAMSDQELNLDANAAAKFREQSRKFDADQLAARKDLVFGVINTPLPR